MKKLRWKILIFSFIFVHLFAFLGALLTNAKTDWYDSIKPSITPPSYVFPIVWTTLFILISLSLYLAWTNAKPNQKKSIAFVFTLNLVLNTLWSLLFFKLQNPLLAFIDLLLLWVSILAMIMVANKSSKISAWLLVPYLLWVSFAGVLNYIIVFA